MPTTKSGKKKRTAAKPKIEKITALDIDLERLYDTLYESIRRNPEGRKELSQRALREHAAQGPGAFVVDAFNEDGSVETNIESLQQKLEWWNHDRCVSEPMPEYLPSDPVYYNPEIRDYMNNHNPYFDFIVSMVFRQKEIGEWGTTSNTLAHYREGTNYLLSSQGTLNPYKEGETVGSRVEFVGQQCAAQDCDRMKAKRYVATDCSDCGATAESCACKVKQVATPWSVGR